MPTVEARPNSVRRLRSRAHAICSLGVSSNSPPANVRKQILSQSLQQYSSNPEYTVGLSKIAFAVYPLEDQCPPPLSQVAKATRGRGSCPVPGTASARDGGACRRRSARVSMPLPLGRAMSRRKTPSPAAASLASLGDSGTRRFLVTAFAIPKGISAAVQDSQAIKLQIHVHFQHD